MRGVFVDLTGRTYGHLTVLFRATGRLGGGARWVCSCTCGERVTVRAFHLQSEGTTSCGCQRNASIGRKNSKHGESNTRTKRASLEYQTWAGMIGRCYDTGHASYFYYGAKHVSVVDRWRGPSGFQNFLEDMGRRPSPRHTLDRHPNRGGNYEPGNCRWATQREQQRNKSSNRRVVFRGEELCLAELAERHGVRQGTLHARLARGWSLEDAVQPVTIRGVVYRA
jgi:hypothetical protein